MQIVAKGNKSFVAFCESNGYSFSALNQKDETAVWLKLIIKLRSDDNPANSSSSHPERSVFATTKGVKIQPNKIIVFFSFKSTS